MKLEHRITLIIHSVERLPRWIGLIRDGEPEVRKAAYKGLRKESWILTKHSIRLWWYMKWHKVKRKEEKDGKY